MKDNLITTEVARLHREAYDLRDTEDWHPQVAKKAHVTLLGWHLSMNYLKPGSTAAMIHRWHWTLEARRAGGAVSTLRKIVEALGVQFSAELPPGKKKDGSRSWLWTHDGEVTPEPRPDQVVTVKLQRVS